MISTMTYQTTSDTLGRVTETDRTQDSSQGPRSGTPTRGGTTEHSAPSGAPVATGVTRPVSSLQSVR